MIISHFKYNTATIYWLTFIGKFWGESTSIQIWNSLPFRPDTKANFHEYLIPIKSYLSVFDTWAISRYIITFRYGWSMQF